MNRIVKLENALPEAEAVLQKLNKDFNEEDPFTPEQRKAISMISVAAQLLNWNIAVPKPDKSGNIKGLVLGEEAYINYMTSGKV